MVNRTRVSRLALVAGLFAVLLATPTVSASADTPPSVTLTADKAVYVAGQSAELTSDVVGTNLDWVVDFQYAGTTGWHSLCVQFNTEQGAHHCELALAYNVTVRARLIDDKGTKDTSDDVVEASATHVIPVKAAMDITPIGYYQKSGHYAVESRGSSPSFRSASYPAFPGKRCLRHVVQRQYASGWKDVFTSACRIEQKQGQVYWRWLGKHASGVRFRVHATLAGDTVNQPSASPWFYFRFR